MSNIPTHASYLADVARAAHQTGKDLTLDDVAAVIEAVNSLGAAADTLARTGNTARDQEMYAAGIRTGEENTKHNAAIRAGVPDGWKLLAKKTCYALMHDGAVIATLAGPESKANAAIIARILAAPGVSTVEDERQAFEAWAKGKKMPLARIGQQYDDFWVDHAWNGWQARAALDAPAAGDALALLDHPLLRDVLGYIEDAGPADVWGAAQSWMSLRDAALAAQRKGDA